MKKYKMFNVPLTDTVKQFIEYCKQNNKILGKELITAMQFYLNNINEKGGKNENK